MRPNGKRGLYTSFIQTTATLGLFLSLLVILGVRTWLGTEAFEAWGWRIPFLLSAILLLGVSVWIRLQLNESPLFQQMKAKARAPRRRSPRASSPRTARSCCWRCSALTAGQAVVWYTGQFYALFFLTQTLKVDATTTNLLIAAARWRSARRSSSCSAGCRTRSAASRSSWRLPDRGADLLPAVQGLTHYANPGARKRAAQRSPVVVTPIPRTAVPVQPGRHEEVHQLLRHRQGSAGQGGIPYTIERRTRPAPLATVSVGGTTIASFEGAGLSARRAKAARARVQRN
jgi:hypothetical protein